MGLEGDKDREKTKDVDEKGEEKGRTAKKSNLNDGEERVEQTGLLAKCVLSCMLPHSRFDT